MKKFTALYYKGPEKILHELLSVFAEDKKDAERQITIHLTGRPGRIDWYKKWTDDGKEIVCGK